MNSPWILYEEMTTFLDKIFDQIDESRSTEALQRLLFEVARTLNLSHVVYHLTSQFPSGPTPLLILTYPKQWVVRYFEAHYLKIDPVIRGGLSGLMPLDWQTIDRASPIVAQFFREAIDNGVGAHGVTMTIRGPANDSALFTFTSNVAAEDWPRVKAAMLPPMLLIGHALHLRVAELQAPLARSSRPKLSPRELECLQHCADGLRDYETAQRLRISEAVVRAYIDSARHKLNSPTRPHAIAKALKLSIISLHS